MEQSSLRRYATVEDEGLGRYVLRLVRLVGWWSEIHPVPFTYRLIPQGSRGGLYCMRCAWLEEPPWRPNNRDRIHQWLLIFFRPRELAKRPSTNILRLIAEYLAVNMPVVPCP